MRTALLLTIAACAALAGCASFPGGQPADTLGRIERTQEVRLGYRADAIPFSYEGAGNRPAGYSVELCRRVVDSLRAQLKLPKLETRWVQVTVADRFDALTGGRIDLECGSTSRTLGRERTVDFSLPTFVDGASFVALAGSGLRRAPDLEGRRVGVIAGTTTEAVLKGAIARGATIRLVPIRTHTEGIAAVRDRTVDAYASDRVLLAGEALAGSAGTAFALSDGYLSIEVYGLVMRRDADFRLAVNRALAALYRSGEIVSVFQAGFGPQFVPSSVLEAAFRINALPE
jgi:ABC-type amino acid transport substrate-binding protein